MSRFIVEESPPLKSAVRISGSKNLLFTKSPITKKPDAPAFIFSFAYAHMATGYP